MIKWHSIQKLMIFGILSSGNLCQRNQLLFKLLYTASAASYLKDTEIKGEFWWFNQDKKFTFFILKWHLQMMNDQLQCFSWPQPSFDSKKLDLTSEAILRSSEAVSENFIKWFKYAFAITLHIAKLYHWEGISNWFLVKTWLFH